MATKTGTLQTPPLTPSRMPGTQESGSPRPLYFICREDGGFVPLIAADELPHGLQLRGVPRRIPDIASTAGMMNLGVIPSSSRCYSLDNFSTGRQMGRISFKHVSSDPHRPPDTVGAQQKGLSSASNSTSTEVRASSIENTTQHFVDVISVPLNNTSVTNVWRSSQPNGESWREKEYCTYWLFHGECAFTHSAKGCKFKHEMPQDPKTMAEVGLKGLPKWWLDKARANHRSIDWRTHGGNFRRSDAGPNKPNIIQPPSKGSTRPLKVTDTRSVDSELAWLFAPRESPLNERMNLSPLHDSTSSESGALSLSSTNPIGISESPAKTNGEPFRIAPASPADTRSPQDSRMPLQMRRPNSYGDSSDEDLVTFN